MQFDQRTLLGVIGVLLLATGFAVGFVVGMSTRSPTAVATSDSATPQATVATRAGHTFNGVQVPPHSEDSHVAVNALLAGIACPCGGCEDVLLECGCDEATEIRGTAAHLFTRGLGADAVAGELTARYHLAISDAGIRGSAAAQVPESHGNPGDAGDRPSSASGLDILQHLGAEGSR